MSNEVNLLGVNEELIKKYESKNATSFEKVSGILGVPFFLLSFYLLYRFFAEHDFHGIFVFVSFFVAAFFLANGSLTDDKAKAKIKQAKKEKLSEVLSSVEGFSCSQSFVTEKYDCAIAIDEENNLLCFIDTEIRLISINDILEVELLSDQVQEFSSAMVSMGGLASQKTTSTEKIKNISMKVLVNDTYKPYILIDFLNEKNEILMNTEKVKQAINDANHWYGLISVLIKRAG
jgi:hypothetical protein